MRAYKRPLVLPPAILDLLCWAGVWTGCHLSQDTAEELSVLPQAGTPHWGPLLELMFISTHLLETQKLAEVRHRSWQQPQLLGGLWHSQMCLHVVSPSVLPRHSCTLGAWALLVCLRTPWFFLEGSEQHLLVIWFSRSSPANLREDNFWILITKVEFGVKERESSDFHRLTNGLRKKCYSPLQLCSGILSQGKVVLKMGKIIYQMWEKCHLKTTLIKKLCQNFQTIMVRC